MTVTILYLADSERFALAGLVQVDAVRIGDAITHAADADALAGAIERAGKHLVVRRACEMGHLTLDQGTVQRLRDRHDELLVDLAHESRCLRDPTVRWLGLTPAQSLEKTRAEIDRLLDEIDGVDSVLSRGGTPEAGAAA